jgi:hypothetical protein
MSAKRKQKPRPVSRRSTRSKLEPSVRSRQKLPPKNDTPLPPSVEAVPQTTALQQTEAPTKNEVGANEIAGPDGNNIPTKDDLEAYEPRLPKEFQRVRASQWKRWRMLADNKEFVRETFRLKYQLEPFMKNDPDQLRPFFNPAFFVTAPNSRAAVRNIENIGDEKLKTLLMRYAMYVLRYDVILVLKSKRPYFRTQSVGFWGNKFHVELRNGRLEPVGSSPVWDGQTPLSDGYESAELVVPEALRPLLEDNAKEESAKINKYPTRAKYVRVDDEDEFSVLSQIMDFSYSPDQVSVIEYRSPMFRRNFFLIGENVSLNQVWGQLKKVVTEWQRETGGSDQRGKPPDIRRFYALRNTIVRGKLDEGAMAERFLKWEKVISKIELEKQKVSTTLTTSKTRPVGSTDVPKSPQEKAMSSMRSTISQLKAELRQ